MNHLLIYTDQTSNRLTYTFDLLIKDLLGLEYELTSDKEKFSTHPGARFSYARQAVKDEIHFTSAPLLFETTIDLQPIDFCEHGKLRGFYPVSKLSAISFDIFASAFFMVSRYEEYLISKGDKYHRYRGSKSMNHLGGFLQKPMVNFYGLELKKILGDKYPGLRFKKPKFEHIATFDIDMAYSYLDKGIKRNLGGIVRSFFLSDFKEIKERLMVLSGKRDDPFNTFDYIFQVCREHSVATIFFFLVADESRLDKNIPYTSKRFRTLIRDISEKSETGIHLSFRSHSASAIASEEISRLGEITGKNIFRNRYHYLRVHIPDSYENLAKRGIREDYSMGYAPRTGFRAGICTPFQFFNLRANHVTDLKVFPITFMDTTFTQYKRSNPEKALETIREMMKDVEESGGVLISLWHNSSFTEDREWKGWKNIFETVIREAAEIIKCQ